MKYLISFLCGVIITYTAFFYYNKNVLIPTHEKEMKRQIIHTMVAVDNYSHYTHKAFFVNALNMDSIIHQVNVLNSNAPRNIFPDNGIWIREDTDSINDSAAIKKAIIYADSITRLHQY